MTPSTQPPSDFELLPTKDGYDRWSSIYDLEENPLIILEEPQVAAMLGDVRGLHVLDVGCGTGRHSIRLAAQGAAVTALDFSSGMMDRVKAKPGWERIRLIQHDLTEPLPLPAAAFDRVLCALVVDHIADLAGLFGELRRVCRVEGFIVVSVMHPAMMLRGVQARFTDPETGRETRPASHPNQISDYVMAAVQAGLHVADMGEHAVDAALAARSPRSAKYLDWPVLLTFRFLMPAIASPEAVCTTVS